MDLPPLPAIPDEHGKTPTTAPAKLSAGGSIHLAEMAWAPKPATRPANSDVGAMDTNKSTKWVQSGDGRTTQVSQRTCGTTQPVHPDKLPATGYAPAKSEDLFGWKKNGGEGRIIVIDLAKLNAGDPRMNIVVHDNDVINVPMLEQGEFYVMGEVQRPGVYSLTGRKVTIKMAIAAAGNLGEMAWPKNAVLIRRLGDQQEQMIPINVADIFEGKKADIYLKANNVVAVGSNAASPFLAVIRNAFRLTYGFGFIYDRNFGEDYDPTTPPNAGQEFRHW